MSNLAVAGGNIGHSVKVIKKGELKIMQPNLEWSDIPSLFSDKNESDHILTTVLLQIINTSELTAQWQHMLTGDASPK